MLVVVWGSLLFFLQASFLLRLPRMKKSSRSLSWWTCLKPTPDSSTSLPFSTSLGSFPLLTSSKSTIFYCQTSTQLTLKRLVLSSLCYFYSLRTRQSTSRSTTPLVSCESPPSMVKLLPDPFCPEQTKAQEKPLSMSSARGWTRFQKTDCCQALGGKTRGNQKCLRDCEAASVTWLASAERQGRSLYFYVGRRGRTLTEARIDYFYDIKQLQARQVVYLIKLIVKMRVKHRSYLQENNPDSYNHPHDHLLICPSSDHDSSPEATQDWEKLLLGKDQTIAQLKDMISLMEPSTRGDRTGRVQECQAKIKSLQKQLKVIKIENQCLINVIENNSISVPSKKQALLQDELSQLRDQLRTAQQQLSDKNSRADQLEKQLIEVSRLPAEMAAQTSRLNQQNCTLKSLCEQLESECTRLMQLFKEKQERASSQAPSSTHKPSISKIREQYEQNLKLTREEYALQVLKIQQKYTAVFDSLHGRIGLLQQKLLKLEGVERSSAEEKQPCLQIQYILQKYYQTEKDLEQQKIVNDKLSNQLSQAQKTLMEISLLKSLEGSSLFQITNSLKKYPLEGSGEDQPRSHQLSARSEGDKDSELKMQTVISCYQNQLQERARTIQEIQQQVSQLRDRQQQTSQMKEQQILELKGRHAEELTNLQQKMDWLQSQMKNVTGEFQQRTQLLAAQLSEREAQLLLKETQIDHKKAKIQELEGSVKAAELKLKQMEEKCAPQVQVEQQLRQLRAAITNLSETDDLHDTCLLQLQYSAKLDQNLGLNKQLDDLKLEMGEVERRAGLWEKERNCLSRQLQAVQHQLKEKTTECESLRKENKIISAHAFRLGEDNSVGNLAQAVAKVLDSRLGQARSI